MTPPVTDSPFDLPRHTKVLLVLDVVESVRLMEADEHGFVQRWQRLRERTKQLLQLHDGRMVKSLGDGLMLEFNHVTGCVKTAFALRDFCAAGNSLLRPEDQVHLRIGAHVADFVSDEQDIYGTGVNMTARLSTLAGPGEIVVSAEVRDQLVAGLDADVEDLGECHLKHVDKPVRAYRVGPPGHAPVIQAGNAVRLDLRPTIAVIPFAMRGADRGHEMLGEALADEVIAALSRTAEMHVISRLSTTAFRDRQEAVDDIRTHLGASYILSGNCRSSGNQLALFVELIDAKTGKIAWADSLKGQINGIFVADDALIAQLVGSVSSYVMAEELQRARSHSLPTLEGYTLLLGAVALMHRTQFSDFDRARLMLEHLITRSQRHPVPHAWLAAWHVLRVQQGWSPDPSAEAQLALDCTKRALDSEPNSSLALTVGGFVHTNLLRDLPTAERLYDSALQNNPNESLAWLLKGTMHAFRGEGEDAVDATERALSLSPLDPLRYFYDSLAATAAASAGRYDRAIELGKRSLRYNRTHTSTYRAIAIAQVLGDHLPDARKTVAQLLQLEPNFTLSRFIARSPTTQFPHGVQLVDALRRAGVPE